MLCLCKQIDPTAGVVVSVTGPCSITHFFLKFIVSLNPTLLIGQFAFNRLSWSARHRLRRAGFRVWLIVHQVVKLLGAHWLILQNLTRSVLTSASCNYRGALRQELRLMLVHQFSCFCLISSRSTGFGFVVRSSWLQIVNCWARFFHASLSWALVDWTFKVAGTALVVSDKLFRVTTIGRFLLVALETIVDDESRLVDIHVSLLSLVLFYLSLLGLDFVLRAARGVARGTLIKFSLVAA